MYHLNGQVFRPFGRGAAQEESSRHGDMARVDSDLTGTPSDSPEPVDDVTEGIGCHPTAC